MNRVECRYADMNGWCDSTACHNMNLLANCHNLEDDTIPTQENKPQSNWHTGTPTEEGDYIVLLDGKHFLWEVDDLETWNFEPVTAWQKIEPYKEDEDGTDN